MSKNLQTILVADDDPDSRRFCRNLLAREGYNVIDAVDGAEAVERTRREKPDVVVMDLLMPHMDGEEAIVKLRDDPDTASIPVIMISACSEEDKLWKGLEAGTDDYLFKPIHPREFCWRIRSMIRFRETNLALEQSNATLKQRTASLAELNRFSESVLMDSSLEIIARNVVETASQLLKSKRVSLLVPNEERTQLLILYAKGIDPEISTQIRVPLDSPISGTVFRTQKEMVVGKSSAHPPTIGQYESDCFVSIPLVSTAIRSTRGSIGVLNVTEKEDDSEYTPEELQLCHQLAQTAALALERAQTSHQLDETRDSIIFSLARLSEYRHNSTGKHLERAAGPLPG